MSYCEAGNLIRKGTVLHTATLPAVKKTVAVAVYMISGRKNSTEGTQVSFFATRLALTGSTKSCNKFEDVQF